MASTLDDSSLLSNQDTNQFFYIDGDWILDILFNHLRLYQLNYLKPTMYWLIDLIDTWVNLETFKTYYKYYILNKFFWMGLGLYKQYKIENCKQKERWKFFSFYQFYYKKLGNENVLNISLNSITMWCEPRSLLPLIMSCHIKFFYKKE